MRAAPARARLIALLPGGLLRVPAPGHPDAVDGMLLIPLLIGRLKDPVTGAMRTYREADALATAIGITEETDDMQILAALEAYGRALVAAAPSPAERLRGTLLSPAVAA
jgi:hypothetical protein